jgi:type I restriction enzyme S subunit
MLTRAFRGELVSQEPNDEPASVLLERIKAKGAVGYTKRQTGRKKRQFSGHILGQF